MSGIAGQLRFHGEGAARPDLERMANALRQHGPDRSDIMVAGAVGLAHLLMRMTPEDQFCRQPWRGVSGATIVADLRLDNRDDVLASLGVPKSEAMAWEDARVLLTAWEKIGDALWPALRGPFAVAIWDPRSRLLTLARDHLGLNVVMWHRSERQFAFASMPKGLFALPDVPRELSEEKFADFLVLNHADHATTVYRNIFRVLPAHVLTVKADDGSIAERRYWSPADIKPTRLASDQAYADALRERLDVAVRRQMRSAHPIGSHLTGGLDSSSVSVLAARALGERSQRLAAFTQVPGKGFRGAVPEGGYADETPYVEAISRAVGNIDVNLVHNDACDDFAELERVFLALDGPVRNPTTLGWMIAISRLARAQGVRVLLGGLYGNCTISWDGWSQAAGHLQHGRLIAAFRQWRLFYRLSPYSRWTSFRKLILEALVPQKVEDWTDRWFCRRPPWQHHAAIRSEFAAEMMVSERATKVGHDFHYRPHASERTAALTPVDYVGDWMAAEKAMTGVEFRDPTADIDVISFCFGVPSEQYLVEGIDRSLIRRAMWGLLPEAVLTNRLKGIQSADWHEKLERRRDELATDIAALSRSPLARRAIDLVRLERAIENWPTGAWHSRRIAEEYHFALTRGVAGGRFLRWIESANR
jgi:asparagine synthase (glutamine-hydrolysing)